MLRSNLFFNLISVIIISTDSHFSKCIIQAHCFLRLCVCSSVAALVLTPSLCTRWQHCSTPWAQSTLTRQRRLKQSSTWSTKNSWRRRRSRRQRSWRGRRKNEKRYTVLWDRRRRRNSKPAWKEPLMITEHAVPSAAGLQLSVHWTPNVWLCHSLSFHQMCRF